jgi:ABC-type transporter Mla subunit MlaD
VVPAVQLDEIFNTFDPTTRAAFRQWQREIATAVKGNDQNLNDVLGNLPPFAINFTQLLQVLDVEHNAVVSLVRNGGTTFAALNRDPGALRTLITAGDATFSQLARNNVALSEVFHIFPEFLRQQRLTMADLQRFSQNADPVIKNLIPPAKLLKPTLAAVNQLSPNLRTLFEKLGPLVTASRTGLPATERVLKGLGPNGLLNQLGPFLEQLNPILEWIGLHQQLTSDFITDDGASFFARTTTFGGNGTGHYLRQFGPGGPETLSLAPNRNPDNRGNVYPSPTWLGEIFNAGGRFPGDWGLPAG